MTESNDAPILFAYDGSENARRAIVEAGELFRSRQALVFSVVAPARPIGIGSGPALDEIDAALDRETLAMAEDGAELAREHGFEAQSAFIRRQPIWEGIVEKADEIGAGAIVVGSKGRTGLSYVLLGSVATAVSQHAKRPVLIIH